MKYLSKQYLLDPAPAWPDFHYLWPWVIFFFLMGMVGTTFAYWAEQRHHKLAPISRWARRLRSAAWTMAVVGLILIGLRLGDAQLPVVRSRLVLYLLVLGYLGMTAFMVYYVRVVVPRLDAAHQMSLLRRQYMPRGKRRKS